MPSSSSSSGWSLSSWTLLRRKDESRPGFGWPYHHHSKPNNHSPSPAYHELGHNCHLREADHSIHSSGTFLASTISSTQPDSTHLDDLHTVRAECSWSSSSLGVASQICSPARSRQHVWRTLRRRQDDRGTDDFDHDQVSTQTSRLAWVGAAVIKGAILGGLMSSLILFLLWPWHHELERSLRRTSYEPASEELDYRIPSSSASPNIWMDTATTTNSTPSMSGTWQPLSCPAPSSLHSSSSSTSSSPTSSSWLAGGSSLSYHSWIRGGGSTPCQLALWMAVRRGIQVYLDLFSLRRRRRLTSRQLEGKDPPSTTTSSRPRRLAYVAGPPPPVRNNDPSLVIAGKMTVEDGPCNIAQYDLKTKQWSLTERIQLSLYNSYSGGEVYSLLANYTNLRFFSDNDNNDGLSPEQFIQQQQQQLQAQQQQQQHRGSSSSAATSNKGSGQLIVVGAFDTTYRNSQVTYCSVGEWDGVQLSKVGEGLCNSALSKGMKITTAAMAGPQDVYVAGSFQTQVWNGERHEFVKIFNIAHFNAVEQVWLPLNVGQITCSWCTVTVLALAWDSKRRQLHVAGKFNAIDGRNVPAGLAIYDDESGHLVAHPGGGLTMLNITQDGVATALELDEDSGVLYVMGSFERLTATYEVCLGLAAYEIEANRWTCLADAAHSVLPTGGGNMLLTPFGLMVAGKTTDSTTWPDPDRPYTIALLKSTLKTRKREKTDDSTSVVVEEQKYRAFNWSWLPGFDGHSEPLHALANGFGQFEGTVFIAGDDLVAKWSYQPRPYNDGDDKNRRLSDTKGSLQTVWVPTTEILSEGSVRGAIMAISQMMPEFEDDGQSRSGSVNISIIVYCVASGCVIGVIGAILCNKNISAAMFPFAGRDHEFKGFTLDTLTYSAPLENTNIMEAYNRAMQTRHVQHPLLLTIIDPQEIFLQRIIGEGTFGRVWSARWRSASVAVKEFVFAQAAVAGKSSMQQEIVEEIIGEAGMMAILRHPNVLQLFGCSLTAQAIWIVSELCSLGSLRQLLDDDKVLSLDTRISLALQVAEGMTYLHNQNPPIIHRDLKSHNIFVHETFTDSEDASNSKDSASRRKGQGDHYEKMETHSVIVAKIGDWGSARAALSGSRTMTHGVGTACWLAPEVIKHARSSKFSDVYGYGIVLWELATREEVYQGLETTQIIAKVANENLRPPVPQDCPWKDLMVKCWAENPLDRLEFAEIVQELNTISDNLPVLPKDSDCNGE